MRPASALKKSFGAVVDERTRVIVLGSLPGDLSLERGEYYAKPTNQFWRLIGAVVGSDLKALPYPKRLLALRAAGIGLWDVIMTAHREGSLDAAIREHRPNPLRELAESLPALRAIAFNGGKPAAIGRKQFDSATKLTLINLPSSSAAYCAMSVERKQSQWMELKQFL